MRVLHLATGALALISPVLGRAVDGTGLETRAPKKIDLHADPVATTFNGQTVPPIEDLTVDTFEKRLKTGYW